MRLPLSAVLFILLLPYGVSAQRLVLKGAIKDAHSDENIPFASIRFQSAGTGRLSDSAGNFTFRWDHWPTDTLIISYVGYQDYKLPLNPTLLGNAARHDTVRFSIRLERGQYAVEVVIRKKVDRGLLLWRKIVRRRAFNDRYRFENFSYELYNKLELDLNQVNKDKLGQTRLLRPFRFILDNVDTLEGQPFLPVYLTETLSDYYYQRSPVKRRELIKGSKTIGVDNESVSKVLGGMEQNVDFYRNFIPVFDKRFISPISGQWR